MRDSSFNTKNGSITNFKQQLPIVSENNEISNTLIYTKYNELIKSSEMVGKASFYLKAINTIDGSDVRVSKRANVPYNRLRGFEKGKVGPVDGSDYIGGNYITTLNLSPRIIFTLLSSSTSTTAVSPGLIFSESTSSAKGSSSNLITARRKGLAPYAGL